MLYSVVELVTVNGFPFSIFDAPAMKFIMKKQLEQLEKNGYKVTINRHMIGKKIQELSDITRDQITKELKGKMISILFDICTKRTFSVLGISATYMLNDTVIARSLEGTTQRTLFGIGCRETAEQI